MLDDLAGELLLDAAELLGAVDLLALARTSRACRAAADSARVWRGLLARQLAPVLRVFFDGAPPPPGDGRTWKQHYFEFYWSWKRRAHRTFWTSCAARGTLTIRSRWRCPA